MQKGFSRFLQGISVLGVAMLVIPLNLLLLEGTFPHTSQLVPLFTMLFVCLGYAMQGVYAAWLGRKNTNDAMSYDVYTFNQYHYTHAILPVLFSIAVSIGLWVLMQHYMQDYLYEVYLEQLYQGNPNAYYVEESLVPYMAAVLCFVSFLAGIVIWFYPPVRLNSIYTLLWAFGILFIEFCFYVFTGGLTVNQHLQSIFVGCLTIFCICITILYNQGNLESSYRGSVVSIFKSEDRMYNIFLVLLLFLLLGGLLVVSYIVVSGLFTLILTIVWFILYWILRDNASDDPSKQYDYIEMGQQHSQRIQGNGSINQIAMLLFLGILGILVWIGIKTGWFQKVIRKLYRCLYAVFGAILQKRNPAGHPVDTFYQNYKDEKRKTQNALIHEYEKMAEHVHTYKEFLNQLSRLPDSNAQLCFAYTVLVRMYGKESVMLKNSDTPREVQYKVLRAVSGEEIKPITAAFERIRYAEEEVPLEEAAAILNNMCEIIHRYMA